MGALGFASLWDVGALGFASLWDVGLRSISLNERVRQARSVVARVSELESNADIAPQPIPRLNDFRRALVTTLKLPASARMVVRPG